MFLIFLIFSCSKGTDVSGIVEDNTLGLFTFDLKPDCEDDVQDCGKWSDPSLVNHLKPGTKSQLYKVSIKDLDLGNAPLVELTASKCFGTLYVAAYWDPLEKISIMSEIWESTSSEYRRVNGRLAGPYTEPMFKTPEISGWDRRNGGTGVDLCGSTVTDTIYIRAEANPSESWTEGNPSESYCLVNLTVERGEDEFCNFLEKYKVYIILGIVVLILCCCGYFCMYHAKDCWEEHKEEWGLNEPKDGVEMENLSKDDYIAKVALGWKGPKLEKGDDLENGENSDVETRDGDKRAPQSQTKTMEWPVE